MSDPVHNLLKIVLSLLVALNDQGHQLKLCDEKFGVIFDFIFVFDELANDNRKVQEGNVGKVEICHISQFLDFAISVVEEIQQFDNDVFYKEGKMLKGELDVCFSEFAQNLERLD